MVTIRDVARRAGVTHTTVSHALSGKRPVAPDTRERILEAVRELGYQPNAAARSLVSRRTSTVGLIVPLDTHSPALSDMVYAQFIISAADRLNEHDYRLLCFVARDADAADIVRLSRSGQVDGMLLLQVRVEDPRVNALRAEQLPFVTVGRTRRAAGEVRTDGDFTTAGAIAVHHLADLGHARIAYLAAAPSGGPLFGYQHFGLEGFRQAHRALALPLPRSRILTLPDPGDMRDALQKLLHSADPITAIVTTTAMEAVMVQNVLAEHGLSVPEDLSLIALNDSMVAQLAHPPLTVVAFSPAELTVLAVDLLVDLLAGAPLERQQHLVPMRLIERRSTRRIGLAAGARDPRAS